MVACSEGLGVGRGREREQMGEVKGRREKEVKGAGGAKGTRRRAPYHFQVFHLLLQLL